MKWTAFQIDKLKQLCYQGYKNKAIADHLDCTLTEVYAKRSQLGITISKCKGIGAKPEFEEALETVKPKGMYTHVRRAFKRLRAEVLVAMARDWTSHEDTEKYAELDGELDALEDKYNAKIGG